MFDAKTFLEVMHWVGVTSAIVYGVMGFCAAWGCVKEAWQRCHPAGWRERELRRLEAAEEDLKYLRKARQEMMR